MFNYRIDGFNARWGERVQARMLTFIVEYPTNHDGKEISPWQASSGKNNAPFSVPYSTLRLWLLHLQWFGETPYATAKRNGFKRLGRKKARSQVVKRAIKDMLDTDPSLFLDEIQLKLKNMFNNKYSISSIHRVIKIDLNYSLKLLTMRAIQADLLERETYKATLKTIPDPRMLLFIDETSVGVNDSRRRRAWSLRGSPISHYEVFRGEDYGTYTMLAAADINGFVIDACDVVFRRNGAETDPTKGTVDSERFYQWVVDYLVPCLGNYERNEPRSAVALDNATIHKDPRIVAAIEAAGAVVIWCARYSPDLNPIEETFHQYKSYLKRNSREYVDSEWHLLHLDALKFSVSRKNMINYYGSRRMDGCIKNLPTHSNEETQLLSLLAAGLI